MISVLKFLFRILGYGFVAVAIIAGISDASSSIALSEIRLAQRRASRPFSPKVHPANSGRAGVQRARAVHPLARL